MEKDKRSATQRLEETEQGLMSLYQTVDNMARDLLNMKEAVRLLNSKTNSIIKASSEGQMVTDQVIEKFMIQNEADLLKEKTSRLVAQGIFTPAETVTEDSFVAGSEQNDMGETVNPRTQFVVSQYPTFKDKVIGAKVGDILTLEEGKLKLKVEEIYAIVRPKTEETAETASA